MKIQFGRKINILILIFNLLKEIKMECDKGMPIIVNNDICIGEYCPENEYKISCMIDNHINRNQYLSQIFNFGGEYLVNFASLKLSNNDIIIISCSYTDQPEYIFGLKESGEYMFKEGNNYYKKLLEEINYSSLNIVKLKIEGKEYPLICTNPYCQLIDYENNEIYNQIYFNLLNNTHYETELLSKNNYFHLINLDNENKILFNIVYDGTIYLGITKITSKNLDYENCHFNSNKEKIQVENNLEKLTCLVTEKKFIECFYLDSENYNVAIYDETLGFLNIIKIDSVDGDSVLDKLDLDDIFGYNAFPLENFRIFINCIHLKGEIGIFTYYKYTINNLALVLQINELILNDTNYVFNNIEVGGNKKIYLSLTNTNYRNQFGYPITENLMKINDNKFTYVYNNYDVGENCYFIVLIIFELYGDNNENLIAKYYKIDINSLDLTGIIYFFNLDTLIYKSYIAIGFICSLDESTESYLIIFGNSEQNIDELELNVTLNYKWKINDDFNITIHNNLFGYELAYKISSLPVSLNDLKLLSHKYNNEININTKIDYDDSIIFDYSNLNLKFEEQPFFEIIAIISEPDYNKSLYLCDKVDIFGEEPSEYPEKIIDEKKLKVKLNFECYTTCNDCEYVGYNVSNQKCLSCKGENNFCFMESEGNCYDISTYNYSTYTDSFNNLICFTEEDNSSTNSEENSEDTVTNSDGNTENTMRSSENSEDLNGSEANTEDGSIFKSNESNEELSTDVPDSVVEFFNKIYNQIKEGLLDEEINNNTIIFYDNNMTIEAITTTKQKYYIDNNINTNLSLIDLSECEQKLGLNKSLIILKMDINKNDNYAPQVEYIAVNPNTYDKINLSICDGTKINVYIPFNISEDILNLYIFSDNQGYNIFNPSDPFYNDICTPFNSPSNTDVLIKDRKKDYYNEYAFCEEGCNFEKIYLTLNKAKCECKIKKEIKAKSKFSSTKLLETFYKINSYSNFRAIVCYNLVFSKNVIKKNYGGYILSFIIFLFISTAIANIVTYQKKVNQLLSSILKEQEKLYDISKNKFFNLIL